MIIITNGQSWEDVAKMVTISDAYGPGIAAQNNMADQSITGKRFRLEIPDNWAKPEFAGRTVTLPETGGNLMIWAGAGLLALLMFMK